MFAHDDEVDEVNHQLTEDDSKLVPAYEHSADVAWGNLTDIHRTDSRSHTHTDTTEHTVEIEDNEQGPVGLSLWKNVSLWFHGAPCREEEADTCEDKRTLTTKLAGKQSRERTTDNTANQCTGRSESMHKVSVFEITCTLEECLQTLFGTTDHGGIITEKQATEDGDHHN